MSRWRTVPRATPAWELPHASVNRTLRAGTSDWVLVANRAAKATTSASRHPQKPNVTVLRDWVASRHRRDARHSRTGFVLRLVVHFKRKQAGGAAPCKEPPRGGTQPRASAAIRGGSETRMMYLVAPRRPRGEAGLRHYGSRIAERRLRSQASKTFASASLTLRAFRTFGSRRPSAALRSKHRATKLRALSTPAEDVKA